MVRNKLVDWASAVKARDGKCLDCGALDDLHAHHIKARATHPELRLDLANGKTLCYRCHKATHEKNRPMRFRAGRRPQRRTLEKKIEWLNKRLHDAENKISWLAIRLSRYE